MLEGPSGDNNNRTGNRTGNRQVAERGNARSFFPDMVSLDLVVAFDTYHYNSCLCAQN